MTIEHATTCTLVEIRSIESSLPMHSNNKRTACLGARLRSKTRASVLRELIPA